MNKRLIKLIACLMLFPLIMAFSACSLITNVMQEICEHEWSEWVGDENKHTRTCQICEKSESNEHDFGNNMCKVCLYRKIVVTPYVPAEGSISFHFMSLGNKYSGDCIYVKAGENDILIDAGSREGSVDDIKSYLDGFVTDGKLEYVIATHADRDHIAGFSADEGIFYLYECETIIDFPLTDKTTQTYKDYVKYRDQEVQSGATHYTALECYNETNGAKRKYDLSEDGSINFEILYNYYYENRDDDENNYSVCLQFNHGSKKFLFTGDLEKEGEEKLVLYNQLAPVELFKAGHHGSPTSSNNCLLDVIQPKICVACCCAGSTEFTDNMPNTFPSQAFIDRIAPHTDMVFVPLMIEAELIPGTEDEYDDVGDFMLLNGNIMVESKADSVGDDLKPIIGQVTVKCSNNDTKLKDTEWFKKYRVMPDAWKQTA